MIKTIIFVVTAATARKTLGYEGIVDLVRVPMQVDLSKLSETALNLALAVSTLERADDLSKLYIEGPTQRELFIKAGKLKELELYERVYGSENFDKPILITWRWDCLRRIETPENYFERHAKRIEEIGGRQVLN